MPPQVSLWSTPSGNDLPKDVRTPQPSSLPPRASNFVPPLCLAGILPLSFSCIVFFRIRIYAFSEPSFEFHPSALFEKDPVPFHKDSILRPFFRPFRRGSLHSVYPAFIDSFSGCFVPNSCLFIPPGTGTLSPLGKLSFLCYTHKEGSSPS